MAQTKEDKILYKGIWHYSIRKEFVFNAKLSRDARFLYIVLQSFTNKDSKEAFPTREYLKKIMGCSDRTLSRYIGELKTSRYLKMRKERSENGSFTHNVYELFDCPQNNHTPYMADGKNENLTTGHSTMMVGSTTKIIQSLKNISIAQLLIKDLVLDDKKNIVAVSKLINKFKSILGEDKERKILVYLFGEILNGRDQFVSINQLGKYLGGCVKNEKGRITDTIPFIEVGTPGYI